MDSTQTVTHVSLCAGYGGIDLGLRRAIRDLRTIAYGEIEAFACANLVQKMEAGLLDPAPVWTDVKTFPYVQLGHCVNVLSGGYPCQPFSAAGKRQGKADPRHLWPWIAEGIDGMRPELCFFENVEGHITLGLQDVLNDLESLGYTATWGLFSAAEVGAPHQRKRVFILAHANDAGLQGWNGRILPECAGEQPAWPSRPSEPQHEWEPPRVVADAEELQCDGSNDNIGISEQCGAISESGDSSGEGTLGYATGPGLDGAAGAGLHGQGWPSQLASAGCRPTPGGQIEPPMGRVPYGHSYRLDELRLCGNGVVPQVAERAFRVLFDRLS